MIGSLQSPEGYYRHLSPQLAAWTRQMWSARGLDLDRIWQQTVGCLPGSDDLEATPPRTDSRAFDQLFLFDHALIWVHSLGASAAIGADLAGQPGNGLRLNVAQFTALAAITGRLAEGLAALRLLVLNGLATPAMQVARTLSEDVDTGLVMLVRRKLAEQFVSCRSAEEAADFWRRHIAGGRAFRTVAERLYEVGLDHSDQGAYGRWRREVLTYLGTAVHSSALGAGSGGRSAGAPWPENESTRECLGFATQRVQEMCAWSHVLDAGLQEDLGLIRAAGPQMASAETCRMLDFAALSSEIMVAQMRWLMADRDEPERAAAGHLH